MQMIKETFLAVACFCFVVVRGRATKPVAAPQRIVIIQLAKLGDMVCTTPMFTAVKAQFPQAHLTVIGNATNQKLLADHPDVDEYFVFTGIFPVIAHLRRAQYDFGCATSPSQTALAVLFLGNARTISVPVIKNGTSPLEGFMYRVTRALVLRIPHHMRQYAPREYLRLLEPLGIHSSDTGKSLCASAEAQKTVKELFSAENLEGQIVVGIAPGAGNKVKQWPAERFGETASRLVTEHGVRVIMLGGPNDRKEAETMLATTHAKVIDRVGNQSIDELKAVISRLSLLVAVDTGPIYVAEAFGIPTVDITGPIDEKEQPPIGKRHLVVTPPGPRTPQLFVMNAHPRNTKEARRQAEAASVDEVVRACATLLNTV